MLFKVVEKAKWNTDVWDKLFNLINDFKNEYSLKVESIGHQTSDKYYYSVGNYNIYFEVNSQGFWITLESNTDKADFDEKFNFIFNRI
jgi:hypothetical protein